VAIILSHNPPFAIMMACPSQAIFEWNQTNYRYKPSLLLIHSDLSLYIVVCVMPIGEQQGVSNPSIGAI